MEWVASVLAGSPTPEALARLAGGLRAWLQAGGSDMPLTRFLGLQRTPEAVRMHLRDHYLRAAGQALGIDQPWPRARALHKYMTDFMRHEWRCWLDLHAPPPHACDVDALLWHAAKAAGGRLEMTPRRLAQILEA